MSRPVRRGAVGKGPGNRNLASRLPDIAWDAVEVVEVTRKHTGKVGEALGDIRRAVEQLVAKRDARKDGFVAAMRRAMETRIGSDAEEALKVLSEKGIGKALAKRAVELARTQGRFTVFSAVDALTRLAGELRNAGDRLQADQQAASLLNPVAANRRTTHTKETAMGTAKNGQAHTPPPPRPQPDGGDRRRPAHEVRLGRVKAAIWGNDSEHGVRYSVSVARVYKDGQGKWQTSESFGRDDLLTLAKVLDRAHSWICDQGRSGDVPF